MRVSNLLNESNVFANLKAKNKTEALKKLITSLKIDPEQIDGVQQAVLERESIISTGVGQGLAIPHAKVESLSQNYAAFALLNEPIAFDAVDNKPVSIIFLLIGPKSDNRQHVKILSRISQLMNSETFRKRVKNLNSRKDIIAAFSDEEQRRYPV